MFGGACLFSGGAGSATAVMGLFECWAGFGGLGGWEEGHRSDRMGSMWVVGGGWLGLGGRGGCTVLCCAVVVGELVLVIIAVWWFLREVVEVETVGEGW